jgi:hypothetical protein
MYACIHCALTLWILFGIFVWLHLPGSSQGRDGPTYQPRGDQATRCWASARKYEGISSLFLTWMLACILWDLETYSYKDITLSQKVHCLLWWFLSFNFRNKFRLHRHRYWQCLRRFNHSRNRSISRCSLIYLSHTITVHNSTSPVIVFSLSWLCTQQDAEIKRQNEKIAQLQGDQIRKEEEFKSTENALRNHYEKEIRSKEVLHVCSYSDGSNSCILALRFLYFIMPFGGLIKPSKW